MSKLHDVIMWAVGTLDAIERTQVAYVHAMRLRHSPAEDIAARRVMTLSHYLEVNVVWAANHLVTAFERLRKPTRDLIPPAPGDMLKVIPRLRDVLEHWDRDHGREDSGSFVRLKKADADAYPWVSGWTRDKGVTLANALLLADLSEWAVGALQVCEPRFVELDAKHIERPPGFGRLD